MSLGPDVEETRRRYAEERARRLRTDTLAQFAYGDAREDPAAVDAAREPLTDEVDVVVLGGGISGLTTAIRMRQAGLERVRVIDRAGNFGGTWYWNRYPGAQCDIESYIYMPMLEETGCVPSEKYAHQPEILSHLLDLADKYELADLACFRTEVHTLTWDDRNDRWTVETDRGDAVRARFVVVAGGFFQRPKLPAIPGINRFRGRVFHTSRWDYGYTGGGPGVDGDGLPGLADKRVGVVGTGATSLQCVPPLGAASSSLHVFQRTPSAVFERNNRPTDPAWAATLKPGWQNERQDGFVRVTSGLPVDDDPVDDKWTQDFARVAAAHGAGLFGGPDEQLAAEQVDIETMARIHERVDAIVEDPATAESLKPRYRMMCKRPSFHDEYLATFNRPNVTLVDTRGRGVEEVTENGVVAGGTEYELDCLIFATGFDTRDWLTSQGIEVVGRDGRRLTEHWTDGMRTFHGLLSHGFPNCFFVGLTQVAAATNFSHTLSRQADHAGYVVDAMLRRRIDVVEATAEAEENWVRTVTDIVPPSFPAFLKACTPGYYNNEGGVDEKNRFGSTNFLAGSIAFTAMLEQWRQEGTLAGLETRGKDAAPPAGARNPATTGGGA